MKAVLWTQYGPPEVLVPIEMDKPKVTDNEILIKIRSTTVTAGDCEVRGLKLPFWIRLPLRLYAGMDKPTRIRVLGQEYSGVVEETGNNITRFKPGDAVFGLAGPKMGAYAEYISLSENSTDTPVCEKPKNLSFEESATIPTGGLEALNLLRYGNVRQGQDILIIGAGGSIGTAAIQLAIMFGATVDAVDRKEKLDILKNLGAHDVIDYLREDFSKREKKYDTIIELPCKSPFHKCMKSLKRGGQLILGNPRISLLLKGLMSRIFLRKKIRFSISKLKTKDLVYLKQLYEEGRLIPVIDRSYPLNEIAKAHEYVESGLKKGNVVINVS